jgi:hypothetical protein
MKAMKLICDKLCISSSAPASSLGNVTKKMEVFDASGNSIEFVPIYQNIS